jgi:hypothetical protein
MAYLDIISLIEAKNYLRVDSDLTDDDAQITRMIKAALMYVEKQTNHILVAQDREYRFINDEYRVYDYPINSEVTDDLVSTIKTLYTSYSCSEDTFTLNVGYADPLDIPEELKEVAFELIELMYYEKETNKSHLTSLSSLSKELLNSYKRFII